MNFSRGQPLLWSLAVLFFVGASGWALFWLWRVLFQGLAALASLSGRAGGRRS